MAHIEIRSERIKILNGAFFRHQITSWRIFEHLDRRKLEMWANANVMAALPNIGGALCSTPQGLADAHCWSTVQ